MSLRAREIFTARTSELFLSVASIWEIPIKVQLKKLPLAKPVAPFLREQLANNNIHVLPIVLDHVARLEDASAPSRSFRPHSGRSEHRRGLAATFGRSSPGSLSSRTDLVASRPSRLLRKLYTFSPTSFPVQRCSCVYLFFASPFEYGQAQPGTGAGTIRHAEDRDA